MPGQPRWGSHGFAQTPRTGERSRPPSLRRTPIRHAALRGSPHNVGDAQPRGDRARTEARTSFPSIRATSRNRRRRNRRSWGDRCHAGGIAPSRRRRQSRDRSTRFSHADRFCAQDPPSETPLLRATVSREARGMSGDWRRLFLATPRRPRRNTAEGPGCDADLLPRPQGSPDEPCGSATDTRSGERSGSCPLCRADTGSDDTSKGCSREIPDQLWPQPLGEAERQPAPSPNRHRESGIRGAQVRHLALAHELILVRERRRRKAPVTLEVVGAGPLLAPPEIEYLVTVLRRVAEQAPVHEVVGRELNPVARRALIIGHYLVPVEKGHHCGNHVRAVEHRKDAASGAVLFQERAEEGARKHRRAQTSDVLRVDVVELRKKICSADPILEPVLFPDSDTAPLVSGNPCHIDLGLRVDRTSKGEVEVLRWERADRTLVAKLDVTRAACSSERTRGIQKRLCDDRIIGADATVDREGRRNER